MSFKCFVPICKNTVGIAFPRDQEEIEKWLNSLKIRDVIPNLTSFVCLDHFDDADILEDAISDKIVTHRLKDGALPTDSPLKKSSRKYGILGDCNTREQNEACEMSSRINDNDNVKCVENETDSAENTIDVEGKNIEPYRSENNSADIEDNNSQAFKLKKDVEEKHTESSNYTGNGSAGETIMLNVDSKLCRLCGTKNADTKNIFITNLEENVSVAVAIMACLYPIVVSKQDKLSQDICLRCLESLEGYFKFRSVCLENDKTHRIITSEQQLKVPEHCNKQKRKDQEVLNSGAIKKPRTESENSSNYTDDFEDHDCDEIDSLSNFFIKKEKVDPLEVDTTDNEVMPLSLAPNSQQTPKPVMRQPKTETDKKFDKVEEELRRVLEGQLTEEQAQAENIIIHVQNDDEEHPSNSLTTLSKLKLPIVIKPVEPKKPTNKESAIPYSRRRIIEGDVKQVPKKVKTEFSEVTLPKGINVTMKEVYKSEVGVFEGTCLKYVFDMEFCEIDNYLYEYRLCQGSTRYLRCVLPTCQALATQVKISTGLYSSEMTVHRPHNHKQPDDAEKKKQMFYYVMKRKMQSDKTLNFRSVYDDVCKQDPEISDLVPLRNVINEICRHQLTYKVPPINSFAQFYDVIEQDSFQKLHFTHNNRQFYQEKFTAEDESKAIVFANNDIIDQVSYSNLMYVDASFKIDTKENFKYQLVTVLVWIDDSYYPILYALVNQRTQDIYKKIFEYLHDVLAPKLRPEEIVTDYEAPLYYALGETYLDSSIGGSVFYYTQNLYKKICALNLSRDLETNSYFRNIYHMLLMLPLLPVNTILDGLNNIEIQAKDLSVSELAKPMFDHVHTEWIMKVTPDLFCVHRLENRINENVIAPFKKLRDFIMLSKGKMQKQNTNIVTVVEKLIELEHFLQVTYSTPNKKSFARDLSSSQKKNVLKAWQYIESHPKININNFFSKVLGYIKCMENQLWIWGFYRYDGDITDNLINANNFSIISNSGEVLAQNEEVQEEEQDDSDSEFVEEEESGNENENENAQVVMEAVIDENGGFVLQNKETDVGSSQFENAFLKYVYKE